MKLPARKKGFSLIELMVVFAVFSMLLLVGSGVFLSARDVSDWNYHSITLQKEMRRTLTTMSEEIRESSPSSPNPILITTNNITFEIPASVSQNHVTSWTQISYALGVDGVVNRTANGQTQPIGNSVQSLNFTYPLDPQTAPRTVQIRITGSRNTLKTTLTTTVTGQVTLRNP